MELLAPAGSYDAAKAAVMAGADAVYMGGPLFSARAYAASSMDGEAAEEIIPGDVQKDPLLKSIRFCHLHGVRVYMTLNTLMKESEFDGLSDYLSPYVAAKVDAFIVQDLGLLSWLREHYPQTALHVSTQAAVTGPRYAERLKAFGCSRVVPARELSLMELKRIADTGIEVEAFIHGALCFACSGQCLMSSLLGGRSGNRGRCAGPCRLPVTVYDRKMNRIGMETEQYLLSMKDLCTLGRLKELKEAGVTSLKIEGRMKSPAYVAGVTGLYRKWLDHPESLSRGQLAEDTKKLAEIFDRGGFTDGYLDGKNDREMLTLFEKKELRIPDPFLMDTIRSSYLETDTRLPIRLTGGFEEGKPAWLKGETSDGRYCFLAQGQPVQKAQDRPTQQGDILEKIMAFGNSPFRPEESSVTVGPDIFYPLGGCKELRRRVCEGLEKCICEGTD